MSTQSIDGGELIPRPERTPQALRLAMARVAPHRLTEMEKAKEEAFEFAAETGKIGHIHQWVAYWAAQVEIERRPDLFLRRDRALEAVHRTTSREDSAFRPAMDELRSVDDEAARAVSE
ncbi:hypothetical protein ACFV9D_03375 [Streptomyces sp. NPDC059875]|uniref:hypothetical protein n=1 Tax=unclassified Streptomyces TaxID=2593676 RepID=UPI0036567D36